MRKTINKIIQVIVFVLILSEVFIILAILFALVTRTKTILGGSPSVDSVMFLVFILAGLIALYKAIKTSK